MLSTHKGYHKYAFKFLNRELALIHWLPLDKTRVHGHNGKKCTFVPFSSGLNETIIKSDGRYTRTSYNKFKIGYIDDKIGVHQIENTTNKNILSFHYYRN
jgi:hypothetical protein